MSKQASKSKTVRYNSIVTGAEIILLLLAKDIIPLDPAMQAAIVTAVNAIVNIVLRFATKEGITLKKTEN